MPRVPVAGCELHVERRDDGEPLLVIGGARVETLEDAGHLVYREQPQAIARLMRDHAGAPAN
ncbi:MAG: hypothetical protein H0W96_11965 [Solirubrobacterales bacterium]|nr:hypothetical protein [Solirubrobacterales bacterium]